MLKQVEIDDQIYSRIKALGCDVERIGHPHIGEQIYSGGAIVTANPGHCADYIIVRPIPPQMIPLGPEDIVPGTVFKHPDWKTGFRYGEPCLAGIEIIGRIYTGQMLMADGWSYKTPTMTEFAPCSKSASPA